MPHNTTMPYLARKQWFKELIQSEQRLCNITVIESMIEIDFKALIIQETNEIFIANIHVSDLLNLTLNHRCELLAKDAIFNERHKN